MLASSSVLETRCCECRAWQLFDWVRSLPEGQVVRRLCDSKTYVTMITLCGPWHQLPRALHLMADMQAQQMECGPQVCIAPMVH